MCRRETIPKIALATLRALVCGVMLDSFFETLIFRSRYVLLHRRGTAFCNSLSRPRVLPSPAAIEVRWGLSAAPQGQSSPAFTLADAAKTATVNTVTSFAVYLFSHGHPHQPLQL